MAMRMQELAERSGLPRTTIHHYLREGLLPPPRKTAPNAAEYEAAHLERLELIRRLRDPDLGELTIPAIRAVIGHVDAGVEPRAAVRLVEHGVREARDFSSGIDQLSEAAGISAAFGEALVEGGILPADPSGGFTPADLVVARASRDVCTHHNIEPADLGPLADLLREAGAYSSALVAVQEARGARGADGSPGPGADAEHNPLRRDLAALCEALIWRAFSD